MDSWLVGWIHLKSYNKQAYLPPYMKTTSGSKTFFFKEKGKKKIRSRMYRLSIQLAGD